MIDTLSSINMIAVALAGIVGVITFLIMKAINANKLKKQQAEIDALKAELKTNTSPTNTKKNVIDNPFAVLTDEPNATTPANKVPASESVISPAPQSPSEENTPNFSFSEQTPPPEKTVVSPEVVVQEQSSASHKGETIISAGSVDTAESKPNKNVETDQNNEQDSEQDNSVSKTQETVVIEKKEETLTVEEKATEYKDNAPKFNPAVTESKEAEGETALPLTQAPEPFKEQPAPIAKIPEHIVSKASKPKSARLNIKLKDRDEFSKSDLRTYLAAQKIVLGAKLQVYDDYDDKERLAFSFYNEATVRLGAMNIDPINCPNDKDIKGINSSTQIEELLFTLDSSALADKQHFEDIVKFLKGFAERVNGYFVDCRKDDNKEGRTEEVVKDFTIYARYDQNQ